MVALLARATIAAVAAAQGRVVAVSLAVVTSVVAVIVVPAQPTLAGQPDSLPQVADRLTPKKIDDLVLLGKVWGFLKYHHPRVMTGEPPWDRELVGLVPAVLEAPDRDETRRILTSWLDRIGEPAPCSPCAELPDSIQTKPPIEWIGDRSLLGRDLSERLTKVYENRPAAPDSRYIELNPGVRNPRFYELGVDSLLVLSDGRYRLLALYRFWNYIEYWFPHREIIGEDWERVMAEFVPRMMRASTPKDYRESLMALLARTYDTHAVLWSSINDRPPGAEARLPILMRHVGDRIVVSGYPGGDSTQAGGVRLGDVVLRLDGAPVESLMDGWREYYAASNDAALMRELANAIPWGSAGPCRVTLARGNDTFDVTLSRVPAPGVNRQLFAFHDLSGESFQMLTPEVAYLRLSTFRPSQIPEVLRTAENAACLVLDLRGYPENFLPYALGGHLVDEPTAFVCTARADLANPGMFVWSRPLIVEPKEPRFRGKVAILVDETTQSLAEFTAMAMQTCPGAIVVGSTTAGADGNTSRVSFPGGYRGNITGVGIFYPDRRPTQRTGVAIDVVVRPTIEGIRDRRDEVLEAAVDRVLNKRVDLGPRLMDR